MKTLPLAELVDGWCDPSRSVTRGATRLDFSMRMRTALLPPSVTPEVEDDKVSTEGEEEVGLLGSLRRTKEGAVLFG